MNIGVKFFNLKRCEEDQEVIEDKYSHIFRLDFSMQSCRYDISVLYIDVVNYIFMINKNDMVTLFE